METEDARGDWHIDHTNCLGPDPLLTAMCSLALENTHALRSVDMAELDPGGLLGEQGYFQRRWGSADFREFLLMSTW